MIIVGVIEWNRDFTIGNEDADDAHGECDHEHGR